jgi:hypothetical protein
MTLLDFCDFQRKNYLFTMDTLSEAISSCAQANYVSIVRDNDTYKTSLKSYNENRPKRPVFSRTHQEALK